MGPKTHQISKARLRWHGHIKRRPRRSRQYKVPSRRHKKEGKRKASNDMDDEYPKVMKEFRLREQDV